MADYATLVFDIDSSGADGAARALAGLNRYAAATATAAAKLEKSFRNTNGTFKSQVDYVAENEAEIRRLAGTYNVALSAQLKYAEAQKEVARAVQLGVISSGQQADILRTLSNQYAASASAASRFGEAQKQTGHHTANVFAQLNDIGVMMAAGQSPIQLALQQGTQLNQVWASMGKEGQTLKGVAGQLTGAIRSMLNPMSLLTIGVIAGGAALVQFGMSMLSAGSGSKKFSDNISSAESAIAKMNSASKSLASSGLKEIGEQYGVVNAQVIKLVEAQRALARFEGARDLSNAIKQITGDLGAGIFNDVTSDLTKAFNLTSIAANELRLDIEDIGKMKTLDQQVDALSALRDRLSEATGGFKNMTPVQEKILSNLNDAEDAARKLKAAAEGMPAAFNAAARAAEKITDELIRATNAAARMAASAITDAKFAQIELDFRTDKIGKAAALTAAKFDAEFKSSGIDRVLYNSMRQQAIDGATEAARIMAEVERRNEADRKAERDARSGGSRAAAELNAAEKGFQSLRELLQKESMFQVAEYEKRQGQLDAALAKRLLTEKQYQDLRAQLQMVYFGTEYQQNALNYSMDLEQLAAFRASALITEEQFLMKRAQLQQEYYSTSIGVSQNQSSQMLANMAADFGQMNQLAGGGYEKLARAQKTFAAGSALINSYLAATQALADPTVPFWGKFAAYAKVLAAGLGAVSAIKGGGGGGGGSASAATSSASAAAQPTQYVTIDVTGNSWAVGLVEGVIEQIQQQTKDGRVVFMGNR